MPSVPFSNQTPHQLGQRWPVAAMALESAGFLLIAAVIWLDELLDLPHLFFGAPASPFRPHEAIWESGLVLVLGVLVVAFTARLVRQIDRLIVLCAWCHRVRLNSHWVSVEEFLRVHRADASHGICPECMAQFEKEMAGAA
jgi:hypothetical protein